MFDQDNLDDASWGGIEENVALESEDGGGGRGGGNRGGGRRGRPQGPGQGQPIPAGGDGDKPGSNFFDRIARRSRPPTHTSHRPAAAAAPTVRSRIPLA